MAPSKPTYTKVSQKRIVSRVRKAARKSTRTLGAGLTRLYTDPTLAGIHFFYQDDKGVPIALVKQTTGGKTLQPTVLQENTFDACKWKIVKKPRYYGGAWPPTSADDLGTPAKEEHCYVCGENNAPFECDYPTWVAVMRNFWINKICISLTPDKGYATFARTGLKKRTVLGELIGELITKSMCTSDDEAYYAEIYMGEWRRIKGELTPHQPKCTIDTKHESSWLRFTNHSCNANAEFVVGRVGMCRRVLYVITTEPIAKGEEITIDYGTDYFNPGDTCRCGAKDCRYPPESDAESRANLDVDTMDDDQIEADPSAQVGFEATKPIFISDSQPDNELPDNDSEYFP
ncbi:SET domain-containing protein [Bimuria novae-zelandiae CBS 107.79]|uniref:SET domain-containing protein n=1 Tax=Bimuria novae-zelandiae CBS 107.79 TaxID=1447943 RepID=A0A6A5V686_9PLEO|nr:SET domain-containing protein [Bimuria novae-zelandiae CBS 107.79]